MEVDTEEEEEEEEVDTEVVEVGMEVATATEEDPTAGGVVTITATDVVAIAMVHPFEVGKGGNTPPIRIGIPAPDTNT